MFSGATARPLDASGNAKLRDALLSNGIIKNGVFVKNCVFTSRSAAAGQVLGRSANGNLEWKANGQVVLPPNCLNKVVPPRDVFAITRSGCRLAHGRVLGDGRFEVFEKSVARPLSEEILTRPNSGSRDCRKKLENEGVIKDGQFTKNQIFDSKSAAAVQVLGCSACGPDEWKQI